MIGIPNQALAGGIIGQLQDRYPVGDYAKVASDVAIKPSTPLDVLLERARKLAMRAAQSADGMDASLAVLTGCRSAIPNTMASAQVSGPVAAPGRIEELQGALDAIEGALRHIEAVADGFRGAVG